MSHYREEFECGHTRNQCRCPGPKQTINLIGLCPTCTSAQAPGVEVARMRDHYVAALEIGQLELFDRPTSRYPDLPKARKP